MRQLSEVYFFSCSPASLPSLSCFLLLPPLRISRLFWLPPPTFLFTSILFSSASPLILLPFPPFSLSRGGPGPSGSMSSCACLVVGRRQGGSHKVMCWIMLFIWKPRSQMGLQGKAVLSSRGDASFSLAAAFSFSPSRQSPSERWMLQSGVGEGRFGSPQCERVAQIEFPVNLRENKFNKLSLA